MSSKPLSVVHQVGQRMMVGFAGPQLDEQMINLIRTYKIGNIILFSWNLTDKEQMRKLCCDIHELVLRETGRPAWIAIDQEGGAVSRLPADATRVPGAMAIAATGDPSHAYEAGRITGVELRALGVNFNLAPVLDINSNGDNPVIGVRSYGDRPEMATPYALQMMKGLHDGGVLSCGKHFPGHGDTSVDSHLALPTVDKSPAQLQQMELASFQAAIDDGIPAIMSSHILFPQLDDQAPATMSRRILTDLLKREMGFDGLVMTDCMEMKAIQHSFGTVKGSVEAVKAGADLVLVSHTASTAEEVAGALRHALEQGEIDRSEWDQSLRKIAELKDKYAGGIEPDVAIIGCDAHKRTNLDMLQQTITSVNVPGGRLPVLGDQPHFFGCPAFRATLVSSLSEDDFVFPTYMAEKIGGRATVTPPNPTDDEIAGFREQAQGASCIVIGTYNGHLHQGQLALVNELASTGIPVVAIALRNPYDLQYTDPSVYTLAAYEYTDQVFDALALVLQGRAEATGRLAVSMALKGK